MLMENKNELDFPPNIPESRAQDFFAGFGPKELVITVCSFVMAIIIAVILYQQTNQIMTAGIVGIGIVGITFLIIKRNQFDESLIDQIKLIKKYSKAQKQYEYYYYNIYEDKDMSDYGE